MGGENCHGMVGQIEVLHELVGLLPELGGLAFVEEVGDQEITVAVKLDGEKRVNEKGIQEHREEGGLPGQSVPQSAWLSGPEKKKSKKKMKKKKKEKVEEGQSKNAEIRHLPHLLAHVGSTRPPRRSAVSRDIIIWCQINHLLIKFLPSLLPFFLLLQTGDFFPLFPFFSPKVK